MTDGNGNLIIHTTDLWRVYKLGNQEIPALRGINLKIGAGEYLALKGRSGSGKTTLLNCLGGLDSPTRGDIRMFGDEIGRLERTPSHPLAPRKCRL